jgi:hypothetical protein
MTNEQHAAIETKAYYLWKAAGCPEGRDLEFWLEAERVADGPAGIETIVQGEGSAGDGRLLGQPRVNAPKRSRPVAKSTGVDKAAVQRAH